MSADAPRLEIGRRLRLPGASAWFSARDRRERVLIVIGAAVVCSYLGFVGIYRPLADMRMKALADIATYEAITARVKASGSTVERTVVGGSTLPDTSVITDSATAVGLVIRRLEPEGAKTWIELEEADFSVLIDWLALLEKDHALRVATIELDRKPVPGMVSARISVEK